MPGDTSTDAIWVAGADRSGTTLMYSLLASHPEVSMVRRTNMWRWFDGSFGDLGSDENLSRCLDTISRYERMQALTPDIPRIRLEFRSGPSSYARLFALLHEHRAQRLGRSRWGDKSLHQEHHADEILASFPNSKMIHMMRDPRDRHASVTRRYGDRAKGFTSVTARWIASTRAAERNARRHPDRYRVVRFEDLARAPETTMREVCAFLDLGYDPVMLELGGDADHEEGNSSFESIPARTISTRPIGRYREVLDAEEVDLVQRLTGSWMRRHDYQLVEAGSTGRVEVAMQAARVAGWILRDGIRRRAGQQIPASRLSPPQERPVDELGATRGPRDDQ